MLGGYILVMKAELWYTVRKGSVRNAETAKGSESRPETNKSTV